MGLAECECPEPVHSPNPRSSEYCVKCGKHINLAWCPTDDTLRAFFDTLEAAVLPPLRPGDTPSRDRQLFWRYRDHCLLRERAGRPKFGYRCLGRDNPADANEEFADGGNYMAFHALQTLRREGEVRDMAAVLRVARQAWKAWRDCQELVRVERGESAALDL